MKKSMKIWAAALAASLISFSACSDKLSEPAAQDALRTIKITANVELEESGSTAATRANWVDGKGLQWDAADATKLGLIDDKGSVNASTDMTISTDGTAVFTGEVNSEATKFLASYPKVNAGVNDGCSTIYFNIASAQTQAAAGAMESADGKVAMVGMAPIALSSVTEYSASMRMISSIARFLIYSTEGKTDKVKSVSVTSDQTISGARVAIVNWSNSGNYEFNGGEVSKTATVTLSETFDLSGITSKNNTKGIYLGLIPATSTATTYTVTTDKGAYTFTPSSDVEFKAGTIHNIPLNLDKGTFASTENDVIFSTQVTGNQTASQNVDAQAHTLLLGVTTATCGGEAVTMSSEDCKPVVVGDEGADLSWITADWENTSNYNFRITIAKNNTTSERAAKVYMEYKGIRSKNWINVHQDAGTGESENPDSGDGEDSGDSGSGDSGETGTHTFSYTLFNNAADKSTGTGFGSAAGSVGDWYRFENVTIDGKTYTAGTEMETLATSELGKEMLNYAFSFLELESTDVQVPGTDPLTTVEEMKQFVTLQTWGSGAAIYVRIVLTQNTTGARRTFKIQTKDGSGTVLSTIVYFQNI